MTLITTRIVERPFGSSFAEKIATELALSRVCLTVIQRPPSSRCSLTSLPTKLEAPVTRVERRAFVIFVSVIAGWTPIVTAELVLPLTLAAYVVATFGWARNDQEPPPPVSTVPTCAYAPVPNVCASTVTETPGCAPATVPESRM